MQLKIKDNGTVEFQFFGWQNIVTKSSLKNKAFNSILEKNEEQNL